MSNPGTDALDEGGAVTGTLGDAARRRTGLRRERVRDDSGQTAVEFTGLVPIILATAILLWQATLVGYTFSLAGNAADEAVRAATVAVPGTRLSECTAAVNEDLPDAWDIGKIDCWADGDVVKAKVKLNIPVMFPGFNVDVDVTGDAVAVRES
ncbi:TadE family protein [Streptomyces sp. NP-1717]|uniref:TadE family protein n=1 Tax=unclassified Streptomyces TaxID=2593676 RepID=UPI001F5C7F58|nr:TadE family protein [Streptomyces sp. NP-1717]WTA75480.1 pilus assembly protein [Streptomyces sp. NBC_00838]